MDLVLLSVEDVGARAAVSIFLASKDKDLVLRDGTSTEPVLDVGFETGTPDFDEFPVSRLLGNTRVEPLDISDTGLIASKDVDISLLNGDGSRQVAVPVQLWLLSPGVVLD